MIIWRGMGVLALVVAVALNVLVNESANNLFGIPDGFKHYRDAHKYMWFVGMGLSAIACWYLGRWLDAREIKNAMVGRCVVCGWHLADVQLTGAPPLWMS